MEQKKKYELWKKPNWSVIMSILKESILPYAEVFPLFTKPVSNFLRTT